MTAPAPIKFSIVIDNQDAEECPELPLTLNIHQFDELVDDRVILGTNIPDMLRELADAWEKNPEHYESPDAV